MAAVNLAAARDSMTSAEHIGGGLGLLVGMLLASFYGLVRRRRARAEIGHLPIHRNRTFLQAMIPVALLLICMNVGRAIGASLN